MLSDNKQETASRRAKMLAQLEENGQLSVKKLSRSFNVSEVTIRNDLNYLEKNNFLIRSRGGALKNQRVGLDFKLNEKSKQHLPEKQAIGRRAAELIKEGDTIILDSGTTTMEIAKNLSNFDNLTVITNALNIAGYLSGYGNIKIIMLGGYLRENSLSLVGPTSIESLKNFYGDKVFIGVDAISAAYGISTPNIEEAYLNRTMIDVSKEIIVVTDSSKFFNKSFAFICPMTAINTLITDKNIPEKEVDYMKDLKLDLIIV